MSQPLPVDPEFIEFIKEYEASDLPSLMLRFHNKQMGFDLEFAFTQIQCRRKTRKKLSGFTDNPCFLFPTLLAAEQASHQAVALFHASLIPAGGSLLDMTAGLGIDVMTMTRKCSKGVAVELEELKAECLSHNCHVMKLRNLDVVNADSVKWIETRDNKFDTIFIDPARRDSDNRRTYNFHDCLPDVIAIQGMLRQKGSRVFIKASPLLDITQTLRDISDVRSIRVVCVDGECKEILIETAAPDEEAVENRTLLNEAVDLDYKGEILSRFTYYKPKGHFGEKHGLKYAEGKDLESARFLYEPNAAVMKLAPWTELCGRFEGLKKLAYSSHLFISNHLYKDFPGRVLEIEKMIEKKDRKALKGSPVNVVVRNYPMSADSLRKQLGLKEGSDRFLYGTTLKKPMLILANRIQNQSKDPQNLNPAESTI